MPVPTEALGKKLMKRVSKLSGTERERQWKQRRLLQRQEFEASSTRVVPTEAPRKKSRNVFRNCQVRKGNGNRSSGSFYSARHSRLSRFGVRRQHMIRNVSLPARGSHISNLIRKMVR